MRSVDLCAVERGHRCRNCGDRRPRRSRRVVEHRIINNGSGSWRVHSDEAWGEGNGTDDWPAMHGTYCTRHRHPRRGGMSNKTPPPTELQISATVTTLVTWQWNSLWLNTLSTLYTTTLLVHPFLTVNTLYRASTNQYLHYKHYMAIFHCSLPPCGFLLYRIFTHIPCIRV